MINGLRVFLSENRLYVDTSLTKLFILILHINYVSFCQNKEEEKKSIFYYVVYVK